VTDWSEIVLGTICTVLFASFLFMIGKVIYWGITRGECVSRAQVGIVSWCQAWESDLDTPELKEQWAKWKRDHPGQHL
jgi:hypothetical protein